MMIGILFWGAFYLGEAARLPDLEFTMAVEESVMKEPGTELAIPEKRMIDGLGSKLYVDREKSKRNLLVYCSLNGPRCLFWGRKNRDYEIKLRSNTILRRLNPCMSCGGSGASRHYREDACWDCQGIGSVWLWSFAD